MADRIAHPKLGEALSDFFDLDQEKGPAILSQRDVSLVYDVGRIAAAREGYEEKPVPVVVDGDSDTYILREIPRTVGAGTASILGSGSGIDGREFRTEWFALEVQTDGSFGAGNIVRVVPSTNGLIPLAPTFEVEPDFPGVTRLIYANDPSYQDLYLSGDPSSPAKGLSFGIVNGGNTPVEFTGYLYLREV